MKRTHVTTPAHDEIVRPIGPTRDEIAKRAHEIWEKSGGGEGHDMAHWLQAERELRAEHGKDEHPDGEPGTLSSHAGLESAGKPGQASSRRR